LPGANLLPVKQTDKHKLGQLELPKTWQKTWQKIWQKIWQGAAKQLGEPGLQNSGLIRQILSAAAWAARAVQDYRFFWGEEDYIYGSFGETPQPCTMTVSGI
jgi:hypothetical protein